MVNVLEGNSFGSKLGAAVGGGLGQGFSQGMSQAQKFAHEMELQGVKNKKEQKDLAGTFGNILGEMKALKPNVGPWYSQMESINPFSEISGKRSQIDTLRLSLEGLFRDLTLKGQFPKAIYERILDHLPQASDTPEKYSNKIQAIEKMIESHYGKNSEDFSSKIMKEPEKQQKKDQEFVNIRNKKTGITRKIPKDKVESALADNGERV